MYINTNLTKRFDLFISQGTRGDSGVEGMLGAPGDVVRTMITNFYRLDTIACERRLSKRQGLETLLLLAQYPSSSKL